MPLTPEESALLSEVKHAFAEQEEVPFAIRNAGYTAYAWRTIDEELADLVYDSLSASGALAAATRGPQARLRALTYGTADLTLELEVHSGELIGQVIPAVEDEVVLVTETGDVRTFTVDDFGCFTVSPLPEHPFRLRIGAGAPVTTPWINLHD